MVNVTKIWKAIYLGKSLPHVGQLSRPHSRRENCGKDEYCCSCLESNPKFRGRPENSPATIQTHLSQITKSGKNMYTSFGYNYKKKVESRFNAKRAHNLRIFISHHLNMTYEEIW
jgi:hypothetical protein